jgi:hypothetical protein
VVVVVVLGVDVDVELEVVLDVVLDVEPEFESVVVPVDVESVLLVVSAKTLSGPAKPALAKYPSMASTARAHAAAKVLVNRCITEDPLKVVSWFLPSATAAEQPCCVVLQKP